MLKRLAETTVRNKIFRTYLTPKSKYADLGEKVSHCNGSLDWSLRDSSIA